MPRATGALLIGLVGWIGLGFPAWTSPTQADHCPPLQDKRSIPADRAATPVKAPEPDPTNYRHMLRPTPLGWARLNHWCLWIEPGESTGPAALWEGRWRQAVDAALLQWQALLPITVVADSNRAQVRLLRRKPPIQHKRASHGRAELALVEVRRAQPGQLASPWQLEPQVLVQLSPGQGVEAMQATALHELGHAFGLWGHSDQAGDALGAVPGRQPVLELSPRDRATLRWLQAQPGLGNLEPINPEPLSPAGAPPAAGPAPAAPGAS